MADWSSDDEDAATIAAKEKNKRVVVLAGMFTLQELEEDPTLLLDLKEEVRDECETMGEVTAVTLYDVSEELSILYKRTMTNLIPLYFVETERGRWNFDCKIQR